MKALPLAAVLLAVLATTAHADIHGEAVDYTHDSTALRGYAAWDDAVEGKRPGVLLVHAWRGHGDNIRAKARELAKLGYAAFALDMYGAGVFAQDNTEASQMAGRFYGDRTLMRARARSGLAQLKALARVDAERIGAIGFCFGGTVVLELARDGEDLDGVVSFHGGLKFPEPPKANGVKARVLLAHGADDPYVPPEEVLKFWSEMKEAAAVYELLILSGAVHSFTDVGAGTDASKGAAYNERAATIAWHAMHGLFREVFARDG